MAFKKELYQSTALNVNKSLLFINFFINKKTLEAPLMKDGIYKLEASKMGYDIDKRFFHHIFTCWNPNGIRQCGNCAHCITLKDVKMSIIGEE